MLIDSKCTDDLSDEGIVIFVSDRSDVALANTIVEWYIEKWVSEYIKSYANYFFRERVADEYTELYKRLRKKDKEGE